MSKKKGAAAVYWQSADINSDNFLMYRDWILSLAMNRYKWVGLPDSCDARYLEWTLCTQGVATIANAGKDDLDLWVSTQAVTGTPNIYDNPITWRSVGNNGWDVACDATNAVLVWDNTLRYPIWRNINLWARRLADIDRTVEINTKHQMIPWIFTCDQTRKNDLVNVVKQALGGEPAIIGYKGLESYKGELLATPVEFKGEQLLAAKNKIWNEVYTFLGIENLDSKSERMIEAEVLAVHEPSGMRAIDGINCRRAAAEELNRNFGMDVHVYWSHDNESDNYKIMHNIEDALESGLIGDGTNAD